LKSKSEYQISKHETSTNEPTGKQKGEIYDLEVRTKKFALNTRTLIRTIPKTLSNIEDSKQLIRSSGSVSANYIEANEALSKKDFLMRIKICRKEAKESQLWLDLLHIESPEDGNMRDILLAEAIELMNIFGAILRKSVSSVHLKI